MKALLAITAVLEAATGMALLASPSFVAGLLFGLPLDSPSALVLGRVAGAALLALGMACWLARDDGASRAARGVVFAMLSYNAIAAVALAYAGAGLRLQGILLWPAVAVHAALVVWCIVSVRPVPVTTG